MKYRIRKTKKGAGLFSKGSINHFTNKLFKEEPCNNNINEIKNIYNNAMKETKYEDDNDKALLILNKAIEKVTNIIKECFSKDGETLLKALYKSRAEIKKDMGMYNINVDLGGKRSRKHRKTRKTRN